MTVTVTAMPGARLAKLRRHAEFVRAQRSGRRVATPHFVLLVAAQPPPPTGAGEGPRAATRLPARLGIVVARTVGNAVRRNRVKRLCRECFRTWPALLPPGVDLVVIARPGAHELGLEGVRAEWRAVEPLLRKRATEVVSGEGPRNNDGTETLARAPGPHHPPAAD